MPEGFSRILGRVAASSTGRLSLISVGTVGVIAAGIAATTPDATTRPATPLAGGLGSLVSAATKHARAAPEPGDMCLADGSGSTDANTSLMCIDHESVEQVCTEGRPDPTDDVGMRTATLVPAESIDDAFGFEPQKNGAG